MRNSKKNIDEDRIIVGRNPVIEALRSENTTIDKIFVLDGCHDGAIETIKREAKKQDIIINYVTKQRLSEISNQNSNQGVVAYKASYKYFTVDDILEKARNKGEDPFIFVLDHIEDPHNLGAIIRTANQVGCHGVIIPDRRSVTLTPTVAKTSAGAIEYTYVSKVKNLTQTIEYLKEQGLWFVCADMDGEVMYSQNLTGPIGLVMGAEGSGVSPHIKKQCDFITKIPIVGDIDSLNVSVATGVLAYEIFRQRLK